MATVKERIETAMAEAKWCVNCEQDFTKENGKVAPDETEVWFTGIADVICQECEDRRVDAWIESHSG